VKNAFEITSSYRRDEGRSARNSVSSSSFLTSSLGAFPFRFLIRASRRLLLGCGFVLVVASGLAAEVETPPAAPPPSAPSPAGAPPIGLEELLKMEVPIVEAASKYKQKTTEAPASVTIITSEEVKRYGYRTLAEILNSVPGLYTSYDRRYSFLGVRGFNGGDNSRVLLLVDGHRMNNSLSDAAPIGNEFILDVDLIDRVEVIRGPGSSLYGNNAFFGVINVITRRGASMTGKGGEVSGEGGTFSTYKGRVTYGNKYENGLELMLSGTYYTSEGQESLYYPQFDQRLHPTNFFAKDNGVAHNADGGESQSFFGSASFHDFTLEGAYIHREKTDPTAPDLATFNDPRQQDTDDRGYVDLKYSHSFEDVVDVMARVYYDRSDFNLFTPVSGQLFQDVQVGEWWGTEVQFTKHL